LNFGKNVRLNLRLEATICLLVKTPPPSLKRVPLLVLIGAAPTCFIERDCANFLENIAIFDHRIFGILILEIAPISFLSLKDKCFLFSITFALVRAKTKALLLVTGAIPLSFLTRLIESLKADGEVMLIAFANLGCFALKKIDRTGASPPASAECPLDKSDYSDYSG
jgi:hypothetical protein